MNILVTGGAGYIGSHMARMLSRLGHTVIILDSMEHGHKQSVPIDAQLVVGNTGDKKLIDSILSQTKIEAVIHFAAYLSVEESVRDPRKYIKNNVVAPISLLEAMADHGVDKIIFSSTAAVYGNPITVPIPEDHPKNPESPYGLSKWCFEELLKVFYKSHHIRSISLRYFNAAGASLDGKYGEAHNPETHIIPRAIATAMGKQKEFFLYGTTYPTPDGTCVRDYIHIEDLCTAHVAALDALANGHATDVYNVATGAGVSNREMVEEIKKITGINFPVKEMGPRAGDPHSLVADPKKIKKEFGWNASHSDIHSIVSSAWAWHKTHTNGYE
jgi:UDP-glucose 4-epimerase